MGIPIGRVWTVQGACVCVLHARAMQCIKCQTAQRLQLALVCAVSASTTLALHTNSASTPDWLRPVIRRKTPPLPLSAASNTLKPAGHLSLSYEGSDSKAVERLDRRLEA